MGREALPAHSALDSPPLTRQAASLRFFLLLALALLPVVAASLEECTDCLKEADPGNCLARCPLCSCGGARSEAVFSLGAASPLAVAGRLERPAARCSDRALVHDIFHVPRAAA